MRILWKLEGLVLRGIQRYHRWVYNERLFICPLPLEAPDPTCPKWRVLKGRAKHRVKTLIWRLTEPKEEV